MYKKKFNVSSDDDSVSNSDDSASYSDDYSTSIDENIVDIVLSAEDQELLDELIGYCEVTGGEDITKTLEFENDVHLCQYNITKIEAEKNKEPHKYKSFHKMRSIISNMLFGARRTLCDRLLNAKHVHIDGRMQEELSYANLIIENIRAWDKDFVRLVNDHVAWSKLLMDEQKILTMHNVGQLLYVNDIAEDYAHTLKMHILFVKIDKIVKNLEIYETEVLSREKTNQLRLITGEIQNGNVKLKPHQYIKVKDNIPMLTANCPTGYIPNFKSKKCQVCNNVNTMNMFKCDDWTNDTNEQYVKDNCDGLTRDYKQYNVWKSSNDTKKMKDFDDFYVGMLSRKKNTACMFNNVQNYEETHKQIETYDNEWE